MDSITARSILTFSRLASFVLIVVILHAGQGILLPLALAALLTFLLSPMVKILIRNRLPRIVAVVLVTVITFTALTSLVWLLGREVHNLALELPQHRQTIHQRINAVRALSESGPLARLKEALDIIPTPPRPQASPSVNASAPPPQESSTAKPTQPGLLGGAVNLILSTLADGLATAGLVVIFVIFMLLRQDDISRRLISLVGFSRLTVTTKAIDEASGRVSRYLLMQCCINGVYGLLLAVGLAWIGLPYVVLWGVLAALFRFIPYVGPWIIAILPASLGLAVFEGWAQPLQVIILIATLELVTNMFIEPQLYGQSTGISDFSLLLAITFWTWLWGGLGLLLATPLTVCLVVFCKHIPSMRWMGLMMDDKITSQPHLQLYQRIIADDETAALSLIRKMTASNGPQSTLDTAIVPALLMARREASLSKLDKTEEEAFYTSLRAVSALVHSNQNGSSKELTDADSPPPASPPGPIKKVMARALQGQADSLVLSLLSQALPSTIELETSVAPQLIGEWMDHITAEQPALVCISSMPPGAQLAASVLCRRLRSRFPNLRILICQWRSPDQEFDPKPLREAGANLIATNLTQAAELISREIA